MTGQVEDYLGKYRIIERQFTWTSELLNNLAVRNRVYGLVEMDVTKARKYIAYREALTGEKLSFTSWVIKCIAQALDEHKEVQAYKKGKTKIVVFDDVDVGMAVEREKGKEKIPLALMIRRANKKTVSEIHSEIRAAQREEADSLVLGDESLPLSVRIFGALPSLLRKPFWWRYRRNPFLRKRMMGTVGLTSVGSSGTGAGWPIVIGFQSVGFALGGTSKRGEEEYLSMTVMFDEDVTYGAPAARFVARLSELMRAGFGLEKAAAPISA